MNVKQAIGGQAQADTVKSPLVWIRMTATGDVNLEVQETNNVPVAQRKIHLDQVNNQVNWEQLETTVASLRVLEPALNTGLILPVATTAYEDIIAVMDKLKKNGMTDLGVSPL